MSQSNLTKLISSFWSEALKRWKKMERAETLSCSPPIKWFAVSHVAAENRLARNFPGFSPLRVIVCGKISPSFLLLRPSFVSFAQARKVNRREWWVRISSNEPQLAANAACEQLRTETKTFLLRLACAPVFRLPVDPDMKGNYLERDSQSRSVF